MCCRIPVRGGVGSGWLLHAETPVLGEVGSGCSRRARGFQYAVRGKVGSGYELRVPVRAKVGSGWWLRAGVPVRVEVESG